MRATEGTDQMVAFFRQQACFPPGGDACLAAFYAAVAELLDQHAGMQAFVADVMVRRPLPLPYFCNLLFRGVQYLKLFRWCEPDYLSFSAAAQWQSELRRLVEQPKRRDALHELLLTKDTQTTKYQRYAGVHAVLAALLPRNAVRVIDFGCGANLGLPGIVRRRPFAPIADHSTGQLLSQLLTQAVHLKDCVAVDRFDPRGNSFSEWYVACSHYPSELRADVLESERRTPGDIEIMGDVPEVAFMRLDLTAPGAAARLSAHAFDAVVVSTVLYQYNADERERLLATARRVVKPDGVVIIQDFVGVRPDHLEFLDVWHRGPTYRTVIAGGCTNWRYAEILRWDGGRCRAVYDGGDLASLTRSAVSGQL